MEEQIQVSSDKKPLKILLGIFSFVLVILVIELGLYFKLTLKSRKSELSTPTKIQQEAQKEEYVFFKKSDINFPMRRRREEESGKYLYSVIGEIEKVDLNNSTFDLKVKGAFGGANQFWIYKFSQDDNTEYVWQSPLGGFWPASVDERQLKTNDIIKIFWESELDFDGLKKDWLTSSFYAQKIVLGEKRLPTDNLGQEKLRELDENKPK